MKLSKLIISTLALALVGTFVVSCGGNKTVETKGVATGLGSIVSLKTDATTGSVKEVSVTTAAASFAEDGKIVSAEFDVVQLPVVIDMNSDTPEIDTTGEKPVIRLKPDAKQVKDAGAKVVETKQELLDRYGMKESSAISKEVYEQMRAFADYTKGKTMAEVIAKAYVREAADPLTGKVSVTVNDYVAALMEAYETKNVAVKVNKDAVLSTGIGMVIEFNETKVQFDVYCSSVTVDAANKVQGAYIDTLQIPLTITEGKITLKAAKQVTSPKVVESKKELGSRYGMYYKNTDGVYAVSETAKAEWFEQAAVLENWVVGQNVSALDYANAKFVEGDPLFGSVSITVTGYFAVLKEAATYAKALPVPAAA